MTLSPFSERVREAFGRRVATYEPMAALQRGMAWRLAGVAHHALAHPVGGREPLVFPEGPCADLGAGTGLLGRALAAWNVPLPSPLQQLDLCPESLARNGAGPPLTWDLNQGLPPHLSGAALLASSFALQWLEAPAEALRHWGEALAPGGWLLLSVPTAGSFPEWRQAAQLSGLPCSALPLPAADALLAAACEAGLEPLQAQVLTFSGQWAGSGQGPGSGQWARSRSRAREGQATGAGSRVGAGGGRGAGSRRAADPAALPSDRGPASPSSALSAEGPSAPSAQNSPPSAPPTPFASPSTPATSLASSAIPETLIASSSEPPIPFASSSTTATSITSSPTLSTQIASSSAPPTPLASPLIPATSLASSATPATLIASSPAPLTPLASSSTPATSLASSATPETLIASSPAPPPPLTSSSIPATSLASSATPSTLIASSPAPPTPSTVSSTPATLITSSSAAQTPLVASPAPPTLIASPSSPSAGPTLAPGGHSALRALRALRAIGADATPRATSLSPGDWRRLLAAWPAGGALSWEVLLLLARKPAASGLRRTLPSTGEGP